MNLYKFLKWKTNINTYTFEIKFGETKINTLK